MLRMLKPAAILKFLIALDAVIGIWAFAMPKLWFWFFYGQSLPDPQGLLHRSAAQWLTYMVLQGVALWRYKREPVWLAVVAGCRLGDVLTDWAVVFTADHLTWVGTVAFMLAGPANLIFGVALLSQPSASPQR